LVFYVKKAAKFQDGSLLGTVTTDTGAQQIFCVAPYDGVLITEVLRSGKVVSEEPKIRQHHADDHWVATAISEEIADTCGYDLGRMVAKDDIGITERVVYANVFCLNDAGQLVHRDIWNKEIGRWSNFVLAERQE
jgi:hypothetical protein